MTLLDKIDSITRGRIDEAILSKANEKTVDIYRRFGLEKRNVNKRAFYAHVRRVRKAAKQRGRTVTDALAMKADGDMSEPEMIKELRRRVLVSALESLDAGETKLYEVASMLARVQDFDRIAIQKDADDRAAEKHNAWKRDLQQKLAREKAAADAQLDQVAADQGIPDAVRDGIKTLYGISL